MITRIDRVQLAVANRESVAEAFARLFDAVPVGEDRVQVLAARRTVLRLGSSEVELLEPDGAGAVHDFVARWRGGLFAAGVSATDPALLRARLDARGIDCVSEGEQLFVPPSERIPGLRLVVSPDWRPEPAGLLRHLYEVTLLAERFAPVVDAMVDAFALEPSYFAPIRSEEFGYEGTLALFAPDRLDRLEVITPTDPRKTMGRFMHKRGPSLYMCYAEADDTAAVRERLLRHAPNDWTGSRDEECPDNLFVHPKILGGAMLGVSRGSYAWIWSGRPERVQGKG